MQSDNAAKRQEFEDRNYWLGRYHALYDAITAQLEHERDSSETEDEEAIVARIYNEAADYIDKLGGIRPPIEGSRGSEAS